MTVEKYSYFCDILSLENGTPEVVMQIRKMLFIDYHSVYNLWLNTPGMGLNDNDDSEMGIKKYLILPTWV